jgi:hypothetical protein
MLVWSSYSSTTEPTLTRDDMEAARKVRARMGHQTPSLSLSASLRIMAGARRYTLCRYIMSMFYTDAAAHRRRDCFTILLDLILA